MIANITQGSFLNGIILYNEDKIKKGEASYLGTQNSFIQQPEQAQNLVFKMAEQSRRKDKFIHISLNFTQDDKPKLTDPFLKNIAQDYMTSLGFEESHPFMIYKHDDKNHPHIHIVASKIKSDNKVLNDSHLHYRSRSITRELELKNNLSIVSSQKEENAPILKDHSPNFNTLKDKLDYHISYAINQKKITNLKEIQLYLNQNNLDLYENIGSVKIDNKNKSYHGLTFNSINNDFNQDQSGIKASLLRTKPTINNLKTKFDKNLIHHKNKRKSIKTTLDLLLQNYSKINTDELINKLKLKGIQLNTRYDSKDNLVGLSFVDLTTGYKYTGEQISKSYTAKQLEKHLTNGPTQKIDLSNSSSTKELNLNTIKHLNINQQLQLLIAAGYSYNINGTKVYITKNNKSQFLSNEAFKVIHSPINDFQKYKKEQMGHNSNSIYHYNTLKLNNDIQSLNEFVSTSTQELISFADQLFSDIMTYIETPEPYYEPSEEGPKLKFKRRKKSKRKKL